MATKHDYAFDVDLIHDVVMSVADYANATEDEEWSRKLFAVAAEAEFRAFRLYEEKIGSEPTRSILARSAAALTLSAKQFDLAILRAKKGLAGAYVPSSLAAELNQIITDATTNLDKD